MGCDHNASGFRCARIYSLNHYRSLNSFAFETAGNATVTTTCQGIASIAPNQAATISNRAQAPCGSPADAHSKFCNCAAPQPPLVPIGSIFSRVKATQYPGALPLMIAQPGCRDFLLPFRPRRDHLGSASMATAITKMLGAPVRGTRCERTGGPAHRGHAQRR